MSTSLPPNDLILHHYKESPYAEKIRAILGRKGLAWRSVQVPRIAPKPDLTALTGGYRKVPVLQVGADVYCDTRLIADVIDTLHPPASLCTPVGGLGPVLESWVDQVLFGKAVGYTFGRNADVLPDALLADRAALRGAPLEREALKAASPLMGQELALHMDWLARALADGRPYFQGEAPDAGEFTLYSTLWFMHVGRFDFTPWPTLAAWMGRMADFGHGQPTAMSADDALDLARASTTEPLAPSRLPDASGLVPGQRVAVTPELLGHGTTVEGELLALTPQRLTLRHTHERCGTVHIHFPRLGYRVKALV